MCTCPLVLLSHVLSPRCRRRFERKLEQHAVAFFWPNGGVKNYQKRCKTFAMEDASNTVQILVACAMQGIQFI